MEAAKYRFVAYKGRNESLSIDPVFIKIMGELYTLGTEDKIIFKMVNQSKEELIKREVVGETIIPIYPSDTDLLPASESEYMYEVRLETASDPIVKKQVIAISEFVLKDTLENDGEAVSA